MIAAGEVANLPLLGIGGQGGEKGDVVAAVLQEPQVRDMLDAKQRRHFIQETEQIVRGSAKDALGQQLAGPVIAVGTGAASVTRSVCG